jgi:DNA-binding protein HU-beta
VVLSRAVETRGQLLRAVFSAPQRDPHLREGGSKLGRTRGFGAKTTVQIENPQENTMAKKNAAPTKYEILAHIAKDTELSKKQVGAVFESLNGVIKKSLRGGGLFTIPGLLKLRVVKKPATKAREGVNPFTGQKMMFKAKPASKKVRAVALKSLKSMVN